MIKVKFLPTILLSALLCMATDCLAQVKLSGYGILMGPQGEDAEQYSDAGLGFGSRIVVPFTRLYKLLAISSGFEVVNLLNENTTFRDRLTGLRVQQQTDQTYGRFLFGAELGPHGKGFFRPFAGAHLALVYYEIRTDVVIPDDYEREKEIRQNLRTRGHFVFGSDLTLGLDLNFWNKWYIEGGLRYLKSFSVPQQLGEDAVTVHPEYVQFFLGVGIPLKKKTDPISGDETL